MEILLTILFLWLFFKVLGLALRLTWGAAKLVVSLLFALAVPLFFVCLLFAGGIFLLAPLALIGLAFGIVKICV